MAADSISSVLDVEVSRVRGLVVLSVRGDLDLVTAPQLRHSVEAALADSPLVGLIVDLTDVSFLASVGMSVLIEASRRVADASQFAVVADGPATGRPLTMMGLGETFAIYTDLDAAVAALSGE